MKFIITPHDHTISVSEIEPGERVYVGDHYIICREGDPALAKGDRVRLVPRFWFEDANGVIHNHLEVANYGEIEADAILHIEISDDFSSEFRSLFTGTPMMLKVDFGGSPVEGEDGSESLPMLPLSDGFHKHRIKGFKLSYVNERELEAA